MTEMHQRPYWATADATDPVPQVPVTDRLLSAAADACGRPLDHYDRTVLVELAALLPDDVGDLRVGVDHVGEHEQVRLEGEWVADAVRRSSIVVLPEIDVRDDGVVVRLT